MPECSVRACAAPRAPQRPTALGGSSAPCEGLTPEVFFHVESCEQCGRRAITSASASKRVRCARHPRHCWRAHERRHQKCPPRWRAGLQRHPRQRSQCTSSSARWHSAQGDGKGHRSRRPSLNGGVAMLFMFKLFGEEFGLLKSLKSYQQRVVELRCSSVLQTTGEDAPLSAFHNLLVHPSRRRGAVQLPQQHRENDLGLQAGGVSRSLTKGEQAACRGQASLRLEELDYPADQKRRPGKLTEGKCSLGCPVRANCAQKEM